MPLVLISRKSAIVSDEILRLLAQTMPSIVSIALDVPSNPEARLTKNDIEVRIRESHPMDVNTLPLEIVILANDYPERKETLEQRRYYIADEIRRLLLLSGLVAQNQAFAWVWVLLGTGSFEMI